MINVENLSRKYKLSRREEITVLNDVSFTVESGELLALLGANGSGKSTLIKCICGVLKPSAGSVAIDGKNAYIHRKQLVYEMGVLFNQKPSFIVDLSVSDNLRYYKAIYNIPDNMYNKNLKMLDDFLDISSLYEKAYRKLSFGERIKCELTSILLHTPKYVYLDEPTIGLDYTSKKGLYSLLKELKGMGTTIIVTTHEVDYVQNIFDNAIIMEKGSIAYSGNPQRIIGDEVYKKVKIFYSEILDTEGLEAFKLNSPVLEETAEAITFKYKSNSDKSNIISKISAYVNIGNIQDETASIREILENVLEKNH